MDKIAETQEHIRLAGRQRQPLVVNQIDIAADDDAVTLRSGHDAVHLDQMVVSVLLNYLQGWTNGAPLPFILPELMLEKPESGE